MAQLLVTLLSALFLASVYGAKLNSFPRGNGLNIFPTSRIAGGVDTDIKQIPYQVQLEDNGLQICGGSILSETYVLTAAHCTDGKYASNLTVRYGTNNHNDGGQTVQVAEIRQHPFYRYIFDTSIDYDASILRLSSPIPQSNTSQPIALASQEPQDGEDSLVSGWGSLKNDGEQPVQLQSVVVPIVDVLNCYAYHYPIPVIISHMICAGAVGKDWCTGDAGGPLVTGGVQSGIASWGTECGTLSDYPGVYTSVAYLQSFIDENTGGTAKWV